MVKAKICGITSSDDAQKICAFKPDAIGVLVGFDKSLAPNVISKNAAKDICLIASDYQIDSFLLVNSIDPSVIIGYCEMIGNTHVQLLADIPVEEIDKIKEKLPGIQAVKVISVTGKESIELARLYAARQSVDEILLDSRVGEKRGGTGITHDWSVSKEIVGNCKKPVWLAGGLNLSNIEMAINTVRPYGLDVETGVQNPDGTKNFEKITRFIELSHSR